MNTPKLKVDSPALHRFLLKSLTEPHLKMLEKAYEITANSPTCQAEYKQRIEGASFNPEPARILEIISKNAEVTDFKTLVSSLAAVSPESLPELQSVSISLEINSVIKQALILDGIRHANFSNDASTVFKQLEYQWHNMKSSQDLNPDLSIKIEQALKMYGRKYKAA